MNTTESIPSLIRNILAQIGENPQREGLLLTPDRVCKSLHDLTDGYGVSAADVIKEAVFQSEHDGPILQKGVEFYSLCEHHLLPFFGNVHVAYVPNEHIIGLSKIGRVIDVYAHRLQLQERLTKEIADAFFQVLKPKSLAVVIEAQHFCMMMRGVKKQNGSTLTMALRGEYEHCKDSRREILSMLQS